MKGGWIRWLIGLGIVAVLVLIFFLLFERVDVEKDLGFKGTAAQNPVLAAQRLMERMDVSTRLLESLGSNGTLPPVNGSLVLLFSRESLSQERSAQLLEWVDSGGFLYILAQVEKEDVSEKDDVSEKEDVKDSLVGEQGIYASIPTDEKAWEAQENGDSSLDEFPKAKAMNYQTNLFLDGDESFDVDLGPFVLNFRNLSLVKRFDDAHGSRIFVVPRGSGKIVVLPSLDFMSNEQIGKYEHASFLYRLFNLFGRSSEEIWFVLKDSYPSIWVFLYERAWMAMLSFPFFVLFLLWALSPRLGPIEPEPPEERRRLMEHVHASGQFLWEYQGGTSLLEETRNAFNRQLRLRKSTWTRLSDDELYTNLAQHSGLDYGLVERALTPGLSGNEEQFQQTIKNLEIMRRSL